MRRRLSAVRENCANCAMDHRRSEAGLGIPSDDHIQTKFRDFLNYAKGKVPLFRSTLFCLWKIGIWSDQNATEKER